MVFINRPRRIIKLIDTDSGEEYIFKSVYKASQFLDKNPKSITDKINTDKVILNKYKVVEIEQDDNIIYHLVKRYRKKRSDLGIKRK